MLPTIADRILENNSRDGWPVLVDMKVIVPGLVHYEDLRNSKGEIVGGNVLVGKDALDRMANSLEGRPIVNWDHRKVDPKDFPRGRAQGIITSPAMFNSADGWYHAKGLVWDEATRKNIENGYSISCAYVVDEWGGGPGTHNQVPYEREVMNGTYTHIAVVPTPRYDGARIELLNAKGGAAMGLLNLFRKDKADEKVEVDLDKTVITMENGIGDVPLSELVNSYRKQNPGATSLKDDDFVEVDGKRVSVLELKNAHLALKNAQEEERKRKEEEEAKNAAEEEKRKDEEEKNRKNAADEEEKKKKDEDEQKNAVAAKAKAEAEARAAHLEELRNKGGKVEMPKIHSVADRMAEGESRYGSPRAGK